MPTQPDPGDDVDVEVVGRASELAAVGPSPSPARAAKGANGLAPVRRAGAAFNGGNVALGGFGARLDALQSATASSRSLLSDRLTDFGEQVDRAQASTHRDLDHYRRIQQKAMSDIEAALYESERSLARLDLMAARLLMELEESSRTLTDLLAGSNEHMTLEIGRASAAVNAAIDRQGNMLDSLEHTTSNGFGGVSERLDELASALSPLSRIETAVTALSDRAQSPDLTPVLESLADLKQTVASVASVASAASAASDVAGSSNVEASLERIELVVEALADASEDQPALREINTELAGIRAAIDGAEGPRSGAGGSQEPATLRRRDADGEGADEGVAAQLAHLSAQIEALRRRMAVRNRPDTGLDTETIDHLAEALALRLREQATGSPPQPPPKGPTGRRPRRD